MKKLVAAFALLAMAATASAQPGGKPDRQDIEVTVVGGQTTVTEETARTNRGHGAVVWRVQDGYRFAENGIEIEAKGNDKFRCQRIAAGKRFRCAKLDHVSGERYKYDVNLVDERTGKPLEPLDPYIQND